MRLVIGQGFESVQEVDEDDKGTHPTDRPMDTIYLDARSIENVDIVCRWQDAHFPPSRLDSIFASQTIEHLSLADQRLALAKSLAWLRPGGTIELWTPDLETQVAWLRDGTITWPWFQHVIYGEQDYPENTHLWCHTKESFTTLLRECGFEVLHCEQIDGSLCLLARKPE